MDIFDEAICALYRQGFYIDEIAYLLNISMTEVRLVVYYYFYKY